MSLPPALIKDCDAICQTADVRKMLQCGLACQTDGLLADADGCYRRVLHLRPKHFDALHMLGVLSLQSHRLADAVTLIGDAIRQNPDNARAHHNYSLVLRRLGQNQEAMDHYARAIALEPTFCESYLHLAELLLVEGQSECALSWCDRAMAYHSRNPLLHLVRARVLLVLERPEEALRSCEMAISLQPQCVEAWDKQGSILQELGRPQEALRSYAAAIHLRPNFAPSRYHAGLTHLQMADFETGWQLSEQREQARRDFARPRWNGDTYFDNVRVLLHSEQGLGDTIQFSRYVPWVARTGARVTLMVQRSLVNLMSTLDSRVDVIAETPDPPPTDLQCPLMSLPHALQVRTRAIPAQIPYLAAQPERVTRWRRHLGELGFKVGISWHGSAPPTGVGRAFPVSMLASIARLSGVRLISLQKGLGLEQLEHLPTGMQIEQLGPPFDTGDAAFLDSAAVMQCLDLVITCDTSIAHLAGALGRPTWIALKHAADWRWLIDRDDSPWYPTVRLFRQRTPGAWQEAFDRMRLALQERIASEL